MRLKISVVFLIAACAVTSLSAHIIVAPLQSKAGATQRYELRVHNEAKVAVAAVDLEIPSGVVVTEIMQPKAGTFTTKKDGDRIVEITWQAEVAGGKYVAFPFTAKNPDEGSELRWTIHEHLADGTVVDWSDAPGAAERGSVTRLDPKTDR